jgi:hypothetical protein
MLANPVLFFLLAVGDIAFGAWVGRKQRGSGQ